MRAVRSTAAGALLVLAMLLAACTSALPHAAAPPRPTPSRSATPQPVDPVVASASARLASMTLEQRIASLLLLHVAGTDPAALRAFVDRYQPAGLILMGDNVPSPPDGVRAITAGLSADPGLPALTAIDQEGATVRRVRTDSFPAAPQLRSQPPDAARAAFASRSALLHALGVSINFGVIADETADPRSFIWPRVLGTTPQDAASRVAQAVEGEHGNVLTTLKHFPGHGVTDADSHSTIPHSSMGLDEWRGSVAVPFQAGVDAGAELVMVGHLQFDAVDAQPATLSPRWHEILRDDLGFTGLVVTDDMTMLQDSGDPQYADPVRNAVRAIAAGNDLLLYVGSVDPQALVAGVAAAVVDGELSSSSVDAAALRVLEVRRELSGEVGPFPTCTSECASPVR